MTEPEDASRPWTQADDDKLTEVGAHGPQLKSDQYSDEPDRNCRPFTCHTAAGNFEKNRAEAIANGLKAKGK